MIFFLSFCGCFDDTLLKTMGTSAWFSNIALILEYEFFWVIIFKELYIFPCLKNDIYSSYLDMTILNR